MTLNEQLDAIAHAGYDTFMRGTRADNEVISYRPNVNYIHACPVYNAHGAILTGLILMDAIFRVSRGYNGPDEVWTHFCHWNEILSLLDHTVMPVDGQPIRWMIGGAEVKRSQYIPKDEIWIWNSQHPKGIDRNGDNTGIRICNLAVPTDHQNAR